MKHVINITTTLALALFAQTLLAATSPVGSTPGSFAVSPSGAATYSIPIQVPPGVNGMQPNISLVYNSQAGNGIAGVGWNIGGLSQITRCGATIDRDGFKGGVNLDTNDKFCLDGQRLIEIGSSSACTSGREFRTEIESFSKVVGCGTQGVGPAYFKVQGKDGSVTEYGKDNGSQQIPQGAPSQMVLSWAISKIQDTNINSISFTYFTETGEQYIDHIDYTLNNDTAIGGVTRKVQFNYSARTDIETSYVGGGVVKTGKRLTGVQPSVGVSSVRSYNLGYDYSAATQRSRLTNVQECGYDGVCLLANWFVAQETAIGPQSWTWTDGHGFGTGGWQMADLFGDGRQVYYTHNSNGTHHATRFSTLSPDLLTAITTGLNAQTTLTYKPLTDNSVYTKDADTSVAYPVKNVQAPIYVVSSVTSSNGIGGITSPTTYSYAGMKEHQLGRGNLGFRTMTVTGPDGITSITTNNQNFPYAGMPAQVSVYKPGMDPRVPNDNYLLSRTENTFGCLSGTGGALNPSPASCVPPAYSATVSYGSALYLPFVSSSYATGKDLTSGAALPTSTSTVNTLDAYGNTLSATSSTSDGFVKTSTTTYFNDATNWRLGLPVKSVVSSTVPAAFWDGVSKQTDQRTSVFVYQLGIGIANYQLKEEVVEPAIGTDTANGLSYAPTYTLGALTLVSSYTYDPTATATKSHKAAPALPRVPRPRAWTS